MTGAPDWRALFDRHTALTAQRDAEMAAAAAAVRDRHADQIEAARRAWRRAQDLHNREGSN